MKNGFLLIMGVIAAWAGGCTRVKMVQAQPVCIEAVSQDNLMRACEKMLVSMQFQIEKYDEENGVIRTRPLRGKQFFEFWRSDNASGFDAAESNLQSLQRTAELTFETQASRVCVTCVVDTRRLSVPEEPIRSYYEAASLYTGSGLSRQRLNIKERERGEIRWIDLGRDEALEQKLLTEIQRLVKKGIK
ncbi:MAG: hypothetical protein FJ263_11175 [Planctomycetes bacterium]|nr:hypothetical protein [Planctomycetota bacterium]